MKIMKLIRTWRKKKKKKTDLRQIHTIHNSSEQFTDTHAPQILDYQPRYSLEAKHEHDHEHVKFQ